MRLPVKSLIATLGVASLLIAGCGAPTVENSPAVYDDSALSEVRDMYELYSKTNKKAPKSLKDFSLFSDGSPTGFSAIKQGNVVVIWDVELNPEREADSADEVLAFAKEVPENGGAVLMKNRSLKTMTAEEFKAAPKAGPIEEPKAKKAG